jgi:hypothetical protein
MGRKDEITLSPKHGVNPSMEVCFVCSEDTGTILLPGKLDKADSEAPRKAMTGNVCDRCANVMQEGVFLIEIDPDKTTDPRQPWRTGRLVAVRDAAIIDGFDKTASDLMIKQRVAYIDIETFSIIVPEDADV